MELDFSEEIKSKHSVSCDYCGMALGEFYPQGINTLSVRLRGEDDREGYPNFENADFCGEYCLREKLNERAVEMDMSSEAGFEEEVSANDIFVPKEADYVDFGEKSEEHEVVAAKKKKEGKAK
jgi:hypothetical protein